MCISWLIFEIRRKRKKNMNKKNMTIKELIEACAADFSDNVKAEYLINVLSDRTYQDKTPMEIFTKEYKAMQDIMSSR